MYQKWLSDDGKKLAVTKDQIQVCPVMYLFSRPASWVAFSVNVMLGSRVCHGSMFTLS